MVLALLGAMAVVALAHTAPFPFLFELIASGRSVWHKPPSSGAPTIYLTFDDGPNPAATPALLDVLQRENAVATFFVIPKHIDEETAPILRRIHDDGHAIALHSHTRALMVKPPDELAAMLRAQAAAIEAIIGAETCPLFRPHAGWRGGQMYAGLARAGYTLAGWSFRMWDWNWWRRPDPDRLARRLASRAADGDIVVMHDGHHDDPRADRQATVEATARLIPLLRERGFEFDRLCAATGQAKPDVVAD